MINFCDNTMQAVNPEREPYLGYWGDVVGMQHAKETSYDDERDRMLQTTHENIRRQCPGK